MVQGQVVLKWGEGRGVGTFHTFHITLLFAKLCYAFKEKKFFFCHHNFMKKKSFEVV